MDEELKELQYSIGMTDLIFSQNDGPGISFLIVKLSNIKIRLEPDEHKTPHIHISCGRQYHVASYSILDGSRIVGKPSMYEKNIAEWIIKHRGKLKQLWDDAKAGRNYELVLQELRNPKN